MKPAPALIAFLASLVVTECVSGNMIDSSTADVKEILAGDVTSGQEKLERTVESEQENQKQKNLKAVASCQSLPLLVKEAENELSHAVSIVTDASDQIVTRVKDVFSCFGLKDDVGQCLNSKIKLLLFVFIDVVKWEAEVYKAFQRANTEFLNALKNCTDVIEK